jgi:hypothetical protein
MTPYVPAVEQLVVEILVRDATRSIAWASPSAVVRASWAISRWRK